MKSHVIFGPPGTGKTRRLLTLIKDYQEAHPGKRVLFCSHTRAAAEEAASRWGASDSVDLSTIHSVCFRALGLSKAQTVDFTKLRAFGHEYGIDVGENSLGSEFLQAMDFGRARVLTYQEAYDRSWRPGTVNQFLAFAKSYESWKEVYGYMDFSDMLQRMAIAKDRGKLPLYGLIVIDEAQDLSTLHWSVVSRLIEWCPGAQIVVAGDDDQSIYAWMGADPTGMQSFARGNRVYGDVDVQVLSQSYRIPQQVYELAQAIIKRVSNRQPKDYTPRTGLDGRPARGKLEIWPDMTTLSIPALTASKNALVLYSDKFVRRELEPILQENYVPYTAISGSQGPLDSRAGRALRVAVTHSLREIADSDELRSAIKSGLTRHAVAAWEQVSAEHIIQRLQKRDLSSLVLYSDAQAEYLRRVDLTAAPRARISTFHGAKGMEADDVFLVLAMSPTAWAQGATNPDNLHRLIYTAVTRTRENLYIYDGENGYDLPREYK